MLQNTLNQASTFRTRNSNEINGNSQGSYYKVNQITCKTSLCDYSHVQIHVKATITIPNPPVVGAATIMSIEK